MPGRRAQASNCYERSLSNYEKCDEKAVERL